jgi:hypothetical protein
MAVFPSQQSPWMRQGFKTRPSDCSGSRRRGTTFSSVRLQTTSNSGHWRTGLAKSMTCPKCRSYKVHQESSQVSMACAIRAWHVDTWNPNFRLVRQSVDPYLPVRQPTWQGPQAFKVSNDRCHKECVNIPARLRLGKPQVESTSPAYGFGTKEGDTV